MTQPNDRSGPNDAANVWRAVRQFTGGPRRHENGFVARRFGAKEVCALALLVAGANALASEAGGDTTNVPAPSFRLLRYDENYALLKNRTQSPTTWEQLKFIPLAGERLGAAAFLSLGGEVRFQYIEKWDDQFGRVPGEQSSLQQRYMIHGDLVWPGRLRIFGQLLSAWEHGRKPASLPTDADHLDAQQLFAEVALDPVAPKTDYLRAGRQEILLAGHQLLKIREGPNVRLAFDGVRLHLTMNQFDADAFVTSVVQPRPDVFDNRWTDSTVAFAGLNVGWQPTASSYSNFRADAFVFDYRNRFVRYEQASGAEHRETYGLRVSGRRGPWEFDYEGSLQSGTAGALDIAAWGVALFTSYRWDTKPATPKLTLGLSSVTGDRNRGDRELNTFNCLFARGDYFGDTSLLTGSNTLDLSLLGEISFTPRVRASLQWDRLWRSATTDGLYAPPLIYIRSGSVSESRDIGNQFTVTTTWIVNRFITVQLVGAVFVAGEFIKTGPTRKGTEGLTFRSQFKF